MSELSRAKNGLRNARTSFIFGLLLLVFGFFYRKILIEFLGLEFLGLNSTLTNLLGFLNLSELGIGSAVAFSLYTPLFKKDYGAVNEIVSIQGWLYRRVAFVMLAGGCVLMCFFPWIFSKMELPLWYAYASFGVLLFSALLGYAANYRQIVLSANQQEYKLTYNVQGVRILKQLLQIVGIGYLGQGYVYWLTVELVTAVIMCIALNKTIKHTFPWLKCNLQKGKMLIRKYPELLKKTKQVFFHRSAGYILGETTPLVIYAFTSLSVVAVYGNYMLLVNSMSILMNAPFNGLNAGVGSLVAEGQRVKIMAFFRQYTVIRYWMVSMICFCLFYLSPQFVTLWLGPQYLMDSTSFTWLIICAFLLLARTNESFIMAYGLYQDIYAPMVEATLNLGLSILLGYYFDLPGMLCGVVISQVTVIYCWKPYFLYTRGFQMPVVQYIVLMAKILILLFTGWGLARLMLGAGAECNSVIAFILLALKTAGVYGGVSFCIFMLFNGDFRMGMRRIWHLK